MPQPLEQRLATELSIRPQQVQATIALLDEGATVPFIARYRKEVTGNLDDTQLRHLSERLIYLRELDARRQAILDSITEQGKLTPELAARIDEADSKQRLEDLYAPYKPKRRTKAQIAREAGLEPLADALLANPMLVPETEAAAYLKPAFTTPDGDNPGVADAKAALDGARQILMERFAEDADLVGRLREYLQEKAVLISKVAADKSESGAKFADYFDYQEPLSEIPSHRALALLRGRREEVLTLTLKLPDEVDGVADLPEELHAPDAVTPLGILKIASINTLHFLAVWINDIEYSLFNFRELNVSDALLAAGISLRKYNGRPGMGLMVTVNGERKSFPGTMGTLAQITIDGKSASLDSPIHDDCRIKLVAGENGTQPAVRLSEVIGTLDSYTVFLNGEETPVTASILVNESVPEGDPILRDGDVIVSRRERTLGEVLRAAHLPPTGRRIAYTLNGEARRFSTLPKIALNDATAPLSTMLHEGDVIEYEETAIPTVESVLNLSTASSYATIIYEGREHNVPASGFSLTINGREASPGTVVEDGAVIAYQKGTGSANVSEALLAVGFTPPPTTSRVTFTILVNGVKADFTSPIRTGDTLEVALIPLDTPNASTEKSDGNAPAASAILSGIAARAGLPTTDGADLQQKASPATQTGTVTVDSLMRYD